ncbi:MULTISPECIES: response regulator [unclassified Oceanobacter]|uniref:ATP-binding response regulator n=1 Tax=unclassified Oceanobacter TaxID=2620260 RepID=UPI0027361D02|nr:MULTISPECIES: response regulator [unclassified Oceanobacter]MDP2608214.1 response regulator [Oceanobacter sp. 1_MG-2023]MDP2612940.1 response regulator [Oceanobacter sp. 2_MG-2023]
MISVRRWSIRLRILLVATIPVVLAAMLITSYHMVQRWKEVQRETDSLSSIALDHLAVGAEYPIFSGNYQLLDPVVAAVLKQPFIVVVEILDVNGQTLYFQQSERYGDIPADDIRILVRDIVPEMPALDGFAELDARRAVNPARIGQVRMQVANTIMSQRQRAIMYQSLFTGLGFILISILVAGGISTTIIPPLERLVSFIGHLARGEVKQRLVVDSGAEIGNLQKSVNQLAASLQQAQQAHRRYTAQLRQEQHKSQQASQAKNEFLAMMSHELRTPLNGAVGMLQLIDRNNSPDEFAEYKSTAEQSLTNLTQLLEDVLVVVDTDKNNLPVAFAEHSLPATLDALTHEFSLQALEKRLSFVVEYDDELLQNKVQIDPSLVRQIVRHLVDNAIKFTEQGYVVALLSIHHQALKHWLCIQVHDTGIGIPPDQRQQVMEAFSQINSSFSRQHSGAGLGLTISQHICQILGGSIQIQDNDGGGTRVMVNLPVKPVASAEPEDAGPISTALSVLIVEDNDINYRVAKKMIIKAFPETEVVVAEDGEKCLQRVEEQDFDLILMDCQMPVLDGFETTRCLRARGVTTPIVACTANGSEVVFRRCIRVGMNDYLSKPVSLAAMKAILMKWGQQQTDAEANTIDG